MTRLNNKLGHDNDGPELCGHTSGNHQVRTFGLDHTQGRELGEVRYIWERFVDQGIKVF